MSTLRLHTRTPGETRRLGERIGKLLRAGDVLLLSGELGTGKTVLAQGIGRGLGVRDPIKSSSFVIMNEYQGSKLRLYHADLYRLEDPEQVAELALDELAARGVLVVEWPERAPDALPSENLILRLSYDGARERSVEIEAAGERYRTIVATLQVRLRDLVPPAGASVAPIDSANLPRLLRDLLDRSDAECGTLESADAQRFIPVRPDSGRHLWERDVSNGALRWYGSLTVDQGRAILRVISSPRDVAAEEGAIVMLIGLARRDRLIQHGVLRIERVLLPDTECLPAGTVALYERQGFDFLYSEYEMHRDLPDRPDAQAPPGIAIVPWTPAHDDAIREAYNDAFRDRGFPGFDEQNWKVERFSAQDDFRGELSFLALWGDMVVGFCLSANTPEPSLGWVDTVGVRPAYRGRGLAASLIAEVMQAMKRAGCSRVGLRVNENNERARRVYERLGFAIVKKHLVYQRRIV